MGAIALAEVFSPCDPVAVAQQFLSKFTRRLKTTTNFSLLRSDWEKAAALAETKLEIVGEKGEFRGLCLLATGELEVMGEDGKKRTLSSEVVSMRIL